MLKILNNRKAQGIIAEYSIVFFLVAAFLAAMSLYIRRTLQARIIGAERFVTAEVNQVVSNTAYYDYVGNYQRQYEPYYVRSEGQRTIDSEIEESTLPAANVGIFEKRYLRDDTNIHYDSNQLSPQFAK